MAFDSVPTCMSTRPCTLKWSIVPRPLRPSTPDECASSTIMIAPYFSASSHKLRQRPMSPSMENTPSVITSLRPGSFFTLASCSSACATSLWRKTRIFARDSRAPSMIEAWFSSSEMMKSSLPSSAETVPAFAVNPDWKTTQASTFLKRAIFSSSSMCISWSRQSCAPHPSRRRISSSLPAPPRAASDASSGRGSCSTRG